MTTLRSGHPLRPLVRRLDHATDALALFRALTGDGRRPHTLLLESADPKRRSVRRSVLVVSAALSLTCRGDRVTLAPLHADGARLLSLLTDHLAARLAQHACECETLRTGELVLRCPRPPAHATDRDRLRAPSVLTPLRELLGCLATEPPEPPEAICLPGLFAYDLVEQFEHLPPRPATDADVPDYRVYLADRLVVVDHQARRTEVIALAAGGADAAASEQAARAAIATMTQAAAACRRDEATLPAAGPAGADDLADRLDGMTVDQDDGAFTATVAALQRHIRAGDVFQVVPSRTFSLPCRDPLAAYARLRALDPSPYLFYASTGDFTLFGASPEAAVRVDGPARTVELAPIAGTRPRGRRADGALDPELDARYEAELRLDPKECAEHLMLVDLARSDVARVARPGTRHVSALLRVERYARVMHLVSRVRGELDPGLDALHAYQAAMNMGTLTGAPKLRAMQLLREREPGRRGMYGGAIGCLLGDGTFETGIVIRAALVRDGVARVRAGAGVVHDSVPEREAEETRRKAAAVLRAIAQADAARATREVVHVA